MLASPPPSDALRFAIAIQRTLPESELNGLGLRIRIGIHTGELIREADDFFGKAMVSRRSDRRRGARRGDPRLLGGTCDQPRVSASSRSAIRPTWS
jgi:class 3 adenylate cyclase